MVAARQVVCLTRGHISHLTVCMTSSLDIAYPNLWRSAVSGQSGVAGLDGWAAHMFWNHDFFPRPFRSFPGFSPSQPRC